MSSLIVPSETLTFGTQYAQLSDEIKQQQSTVSNKRKVLQTKEAQLIEDLKSKSMDKLETDDGRVFLLSYKNKKPSLAKKEFLSKGLELYWNHLSSIEHNTMTGELFATRCLAYLNELKEQQSQQNPYIKEKCGGNKKQKTSNNNNGQENHEQNNLILNLLGD